ncbi:MAG: SH3 domain-containing protein [Gemmatimonadota bacterium]|nr:SH3 domain-containing protein [Gemmatimonadota bacterium]
MILTALAVFAQLQISVTATDTIALAGFADVRVRVRAPSMKELRLTPPSFRPFSLARATAAEKRDTDARGRALVLAEYHYILAPTREGTFVIPPFSARWGPQRAIAQPLRITVRRDPHGPAPPDVVARAPIDSTILVNFHAMVVPETVYVGQQSTYQLGVFLERNVRDRLRRMEAIAPEIRGLMSYDAPAPASGFPARAVGTHRYEATVYQRPIFPLAAGLFHIPPARLVYAMPLSYSFFSREESVELASDSVPIVVIDPPAASRPSGFTGAVGTLRAEARLDTAAARVGDPLPLSVRIAGTGNVKLFPRPVLEIPWASAVASSERVELDQDALIVRGYKEFRWVLTPLAAGRLVLPPIRYVYFDPQRREYATAATQPESLTVMPGTLARIDSAKAERAPRLALRTKFRGELGRPMYGERPFWLVLGLVPLPALLLGLRQRPRRESVRRWARRLRSLARAGRERDDLRRVRRAFVNAVAERLRVPPVMVAEPGALARAARRAGTTAAAADRAGALLLALNESAFGPLEGVRPEALGDEAARQAWEIYRAIDRESVSLLGDWSRMPVVLFALCALGLSAAAAELPSENAVAFDRGVAAYVRGNAPDAAREFAALAVRAPRAPDVWANLGTASWEQADTAQAVLGWQKALRLEPLATDVRERLQLLPPEGPDAGTVPALPALPIALAAALLWLAGWVALAWRSLRRRSGSLTLAGGMIVAALLSAGAAASVDRTLAAPQLAVLSATTPLRTDPQLAADRGAALRVGSVIHVDQRVGEWAHVTASDREGWVEASLLLPLGAPAG